MMPCWYPGVTDVLAMGSSASESADKHDRFAAVDICPMFKTLIEARVICLTRGTGGFLHHCARH